MNIDTELLRLIVAFFLGFLDTMLLFYALRLRKKTNDPLKEIQSWDSK